MYRFKLISTVKPT